MSWEKNPGSFSRCVHYREGDVTERVTLPRGWLVSQSLFWTTMVYWLPPTHTHPDDVPRRANVSVGLQNSVCLSPLGIRAGTASFPSAGYQVSPCRDGSLFPSQLARYLSLCLPSCLVFFPPFFLYMFVLMWLSFLLFVSYMIDWWLYLVMVLL